jgi:pimeloyl-ACP methyl ester carboxylesterase
MLGMTRTVALAVVALLAFGCTIAAASPAKSKTAAIAAVTPSPALPPQETEPPPKPRVYLFRGAMGPIFSTGMDTLAEKLTAVGLQADVYEFTICRFVANRAITTYRENPAPIVLIGHSMGGLCSVIFAEMMEEENIPVSLIVTIDPAHATGDVPLNVERFINIYMSDSVLGGGDVVAVPGFRGHYASFDLKELTKITHINIDKASELHAQIISMVTQLPRVPTQTVGDAVPLRYLVPAGSKVELWDSGIRLPAKRGDTLEKIAALYRVPLWSLAQANPTLGSTPIAAGQEIVIPRHLLPAATNDRVAVDGRQ